MDQPKHNKRDQPDKKIKPPDFDVVTEGYSWGKRWRMKTKCERDIHRFVPRYDEIEMDRGSMEISHVSLGDLRELFIRRVYVYDICRRCGKTIKREGLNE